MRVLALALVACSGGDPEETDDITLTADELAMVRSMSPLPELPADPTNAVADDADAIALGQRLYFDTRLSGDGEVSCATCHDPDQGWADGEALPVDFPGVPRHTPTIWNAGYNPWQFWDGRCDTLWCQATGPIEAAKEMDGSRIAVAQLVADSDLTDAYETVFGDLPDLSHLPTSGRPGEPDYDDLSDSDKLLVDTVFTDVAKAIAAYERQIVSRDAPFDDFVADMSADPPHISVEAQRGLKLFVSDAGCHFCHFGPNFTSNQFFNIGLEDLDGMDPDDTGRLDGVAEVQSHPFNALGAFSDDPDPDSDAGIRLRFLAQTDEQLGQFKVPTLRSVASNPPYMRGGHFATLGDVIDHYDNPQTRPSQGHRDELLLPLDLSQADKDALVAFLETLSGVPLDEALTQPP